MNCYFYSIFIVMVMICYQFVSTTLFVDDTWYVRTNNGFPYINILFYSYSYSYSLGQEIDTPSQQVNNDLLYGSR